MYVKYISIYRGLYSVSIKELTLDMGSFLRTIFCLFTIFQIIEGTPVIFTISIDTKIRCLKTTN